MAKFVKFANAEIPVSGAPNEDIFVNPEFVRLISADPHGGTLIQLDRQQVSVREDVEKVVKALS